jgi:transcriptional regulator with XRE-family HTH domain
MDSYISGIGKRIRDIRKEKNLYASDIARKANVSNGLISRIENGRTVPSLPVLLAIIQALEIQPGEFFGNIIDSQEQRYIVIRSGNYEPIEKETEATGFTYHRIFGKHFSSVGCEFVLLRLEPECRRNVVETDAFEFKYIISGRCSYQIGDDIIELNEGDSIFFDGRVPHVPTNSSSHPCTMLVAYLFAE